MLNYDLERGGIRFVIFMLGIFLNFNFDWVSKVKVWRNTSLPVQTVLWHHKIEASQSRGKKDDVNPY